MIIHIKRKRALLDAAAEMFGSQGYAATSVSQLARKVGLSKPGFYHHVKGKKELLYEICHFSMTHLLGGAREALAADAGPVERLTDVIRRHASFYREHSAMLASLRQVRFLAPPQRRELQQMQRVYLHIVRDMIGEGQAQGTFRAANPTVAAFCVFAVLNGPATWYDPYGALTWDQVTDELCAMCLNGLRAPRLRSRATVIQAPFRYQS